MTVSADEYSAEAPPFASFFGVLGGSFAMCLAAAGATYATAKAGTGISGMAVVAPNAVMKALLPVVMAGIVGIYGLVVSVIIAQKVKPDMTLFSAFACCTSGLAVGISGLGAGYAIGIVGDIGVRTMSREPNVFVGMVLTLIFAEVLGLYGMIVGLLLAAKA